MEKYIDGNFIEKKERDEMLLMHLLKKGFLNINEKPLIDNTLLYIRDNRLVFGCIIEDVEPIMVKVLNEIESLILGWPQISIKKWNWTEADFHISTNSFNNNRPSPECEECIKDFFSTYEDKSTRSTLYYWEDKEFINKLKSHDLKLHDLK